MHPFSISVKNISVKNNHIARIFKVMVLFGLILVVNTAVTSAAPPLPVANADNPPATDVFEDAAGPTINVLANDTLGDAPTLIVGVSAVAPAGSGSVAIGGGGTTINYTAPGADFNATGLTFTYTITDGDNDSSVGNVTFDVVAVNDAPSFTIPAGPVMVNEDIAFSQANWATAISAGPANESAQTLSFIVTPANAALFSIAPAISPAGTLTFTPAPNLFGTTNVTVQLMDNGGTANGGVDSSGVANFTITINSSNDAPSFTSGGNITVNEDSAAFSQPGWATAISPGPADEAAQTLNFIVTPAVPALFSTPPAISPTGALTFTPAPNAAGTTDVAVQLMDNGGTANGGVDKSAIINFSITIDDINDAPSFTPGGNPANVNEDSGPFSQNGWATNISKGPASESGQTLNFIVTPQDPTLFSAGPAVSTAGAFSFTPAPDAFGATKVTIRLMDSGGTANGGIDTSATFTRTITIDPVNDRPTFTKGSDITVPEDSPAFSENGWATNISPGAANESTQTLTFNVTANSNPTLFAVAPAVSPTGRLTFTPAAAKSGSATITIALTDDGGTANGGDDRSVARQFKITVLNVNKAPSFTKGPDISVDEDSGPFSQNGWATNISPGGPDESGQSVSFIVTNNTNTGLFSSGPTISPNGRLRFTPADNANGMATITIVLKDSGGTANGGDDTSPAETFKITVDAVNDPPNARRDTAQTTLNTAVTFVVVDNDTDVDNPIDPTSVTVTQQPANGSAAANPTNGRITFTPDNGFIGSDFLRYEICDPGGLCDDARVDLDVGAIDLELTKSLTPALSQVAPGDLIVYTLEVSNRGAGAASGVVISDTVPINTRFNAGESSGTWSCADRSPAGTVCKQTVGGLAGSGGKTSVQFAVDVLDPLTQDDTEIINSAEASDDAGNGPDADLNNNRATVSVRLTTAVIIQAAKTDSLAVDADSDSLASPGDTIHYSIVVANDGNITAQNVVLADPLDPATTVVVGSVSTSQGTVTIGNSAGESTVEVAIGEIAAGADAIISFDVKVRSPLPAMISEIANQALISGANFTTVPTNDPDTLAAGDPTATTIDASAELIASKVDNLAVDADNNGLPSPGDTLIYVVTITNRGNQAAADVLFIDSVGDNISLITGSVTTDQGTVTNGNSGGDIGIGVNVGTIAGGGGSIEITFRVKIANPLPGNVFELVNQGTVTADGLKPILTDDPALPNADDPTRTAVNADVAVHASLTDYLFIDLDGNDTVSSGDTLLYRITVVNDGNKTALGVKIGNSLDPHLVLQPGTVQTNRGSVVSGNSPSDTVVSIDVGTLPVDITAVVSFQVKLRDVNELLALSNQLLVVLDDPSGSGIVIEVQSDDPDTTKINDPTITPVKGADIEDDPSIIYVPLIAIRR